MIRDESSFFQKERGFFVLQIDHITDRFIVSRNIEKIISSEVVRKEISLLSSARFNLV